MLINDTNDPEIVWTNQMRFGRLIPQMVTHIGFKNKPWETGGRHITDFACWRRPARTHKWNVDAAPMALKRAPATNETHDKPATANTIRPSALWFGGRRGSGFASGRACFFGRRSLSHFGRGVAANGKGLPRCLARH